MNWLNIDPDLPTLSFAFDTSTITQRFEQAWPARRPSACPRTTVKLGRRQDVHYIPATRCVTTYPLAVEHGESAPWLTIGVVEAIQHGLNHRLFTADPQLPGLAMATDSALMHERFAALAKGSEQADGVQAC